MNFDKKISLFLIIILIIAVTATIYIVINPNPGEKFTEFYILGPDGKAGNYPVNLSLGESGNVIVGIINHEQGNVNYNLTLKLNGNTIQSENIVLLDKEKREIPIIFKPVKTGANQKLEFLLYKLPDNQNIYRSLELNIDVK